MNRNLLAAMLLGGALLAGCGGPPPPPTAPVEVRGVVTAGPGGPVATGTIHVNLYHAWSLTGELRHPLQFITSFDLEGGEFDHRFDYPVSQGEGLAVYAWQDTNGDGIFCTPTDRSELSGLTVLEQFTPGGAPLDVRVALAEPCAGQDWFFPGGKAE